MSKPRSMYWWRYRNNDMEAQFINVSEDAELIGQRLMRRYFDSQREIPANVAAIAKVTRVQPGRVQDAWEDLAYLFDLQGAVVKIPWMDEEIEQAKARADRGRKGANGRWEGKNA